MPVAGTGLGGGTTRIESPEVARDLTVFREREFKNGSVLAIRPLIARPVSLEMGALFALRRDLEVDSSSLASTIS